MAVKSGAALPGDACAKTAPEEKINRETQIADISHLSLKSR